MYIRWINISYKVDKLYSWKKQTIDWIKMNHPTKAHHVPVGSEFKKTEQLPHCNPDRIWEPESQSVTNRNETWNPWDYRNSKETNNWLVVSTHLKNISQNGNLPQKGVKIKIFETTT